MTDVINMIWLFRIAKVNLYFVHLFENDGLCGTSEKDFQDYLSFHEDAFETVHCS